jgi:hypothetical protein
VAGEQPVRIVGMCLSATMALLRLGGVVVGHGVPLAAGAREALAAAYAWLS